MARAEKTVNSPWKSIFFSVSKTFGYVTLAGTIVVALIAKLPGALGFLSGSVLVFLWFALDVVVAEQAQKKAMAQVARALMVAYVIKVMLGMVVLFSLPLPRIILNGWMLLGAVLAVVVWLGMSMRTIMNLRILYFDDYDPGLTQASQKDKK